MSERAFTGDASPDWQAETNPVAFTVVRQADGTYHVTASDGGPPSFLISFATKAEADAWIRKVQRLDA